MKTLWIRQTEVAAPGWYFFEPLSEDPKISFPVSIVRVQFESSKSKSGPLYVVQMDELEEDTVQEIEHVLGFYYPVTFPPEREGRAKKVIKPEW